MTSRPVCSEDFPDPLRLEGVMAEDDLDNYGGSMEQLLTELEAAKLLRVSVQLLRKWRGKGEGPEYMKFGKCVRYSPITIERFSSARRSGGIAVRTAGELEA